MSKIIPFGKYKGQPIAVLQNDLDYLDWLTGQAWFRERYGALYSVVINNFHGPTETPEHNELQAMFLDDHLCIALARQLKEFADPRAALVQDIDNLEHDSDVIYRKQWLPKLRLQLASYDRAGMDSPLKITQRSFELGGWDVSFRANMSFLLDWQHERVFLVEVKPCLGDDYPAFLRQMRARSHNSGETRWLIFDRLTASGASLEQIRAIFHSAGIWVLAIAELRAP